VIFRSISGIVWLQDLDY